MVDLTERVTQHALDSLPGFGFERDLQKSACREFSNRLSLLLADLCRPFVANLHEGVARLNRGVIEGKSEQDLISWSIHEATTFWNMAASRFCDRVALHETINLGPERIRCETAALYIAWLKEEWEHSAIERLRIRKLIPKSQKHAIKKRDYSWTPYLVDVLWGRGGQ